MSKVILVRTDKGRWIWWPGLCVVDYVPKGRRVPILSYGLTIRQDTEVEALRYIVKRMMGDRA